MKNKLFLFVLISLFSMPLVASVSSLNCPIELSTERGVFCGFSSKRIDSYVAVSDAKVGTEEDPIKFMPANDTNSFVTGAFYFYCQIITVSKVSISILESPGFNFSETTVDYINSGFDTAQKFTGSSLSSVTLYDESALSESDTKYPRIFCCQFNFSIPFSAVSDKTGQSKTTLKIGVSTI